MNTDARRDEFVSAAYELFKEKGIEQTSIKDITRRIGVTRSLFYHYFCDKRDVTNAVVDRQVECFVARVGQWEAKHSQNYTRESLYEVVGILRSFLIGLGSLRDCITLEQNVSLQQRFTMGCANQLAERLTGSMQREYARMGLTPPVQHVHESVYLLTVGLIGLLYHEASLSDDVAVDLIMDTMHFDLA